MDMGALAKDGHILRSEFAEGALPALMLRPLMTNLGIRVISTTAIGVATACPTTSTITIGGPDQISSRGPYANCVREYTSALAWGFAQIRLAKLQQEGLAHAYAAAFLCPLHLLRTAPELQGDPRARDIERLAKRLAVAPWVTAEALRGHHLVDRVLFSAITRKEQNDGGTIFTQEGQIEESKG